MKILPICLCLLAVLGGMDAASAQGTAPTPVSYLISPDGQHLAYARSGWNDSGDPISRVMVCNPDGSQSREIATFPGQAFGGMSVCWVGNDRLYCDQRDDPSYAVLALDGTLEPEGILPAGCEVLRKVLSPDGQRVAFIGSYTPPGGVKQAGLGFVQLDTLAVRIISGSFDTAPAWSPDSASVAVDSGEKHVLQIINATTGAVTDTGQEGCECAWSPGGKTLAMMRPAGE